MAGTKSGCHGPTGGRDTIGLGLSVFALSAFIETFRFGALTITLLTVSLVCNLIVLPALLSGPVGRCLAGCKPQQDDQPDGLSSPH